MMFGVGLHFSIKDLMEVKAIAIPGAVLQIALGTLAGYGHARAFGWSAEAGIMLGLVGEHRLHRGADQEPDRRGALPDHGRARRHRMAHRRGPRHHRDPGHFAGCFRSGEVSGAQLASEIGIALVKTAAFVAIMLVVGVAPAAVAAAPHRPLQLARAVPAGRGGHRPRHGHRRVGAVRRVGGAGRIPSGRGGGRLQALASRGGRGHPVPGPVLDHLLCLGGHDGEPCDAGKPPRGARVPGGPHHGRQMAHQHGAGALRCRPGRAPRSPWPPGLSQIGEFSFIIGQTGLSLASCPPSSTA